MLTIQPNFSKVQQYAQRPLHFKGQSAEITEDYVNEQRDFYEKQVREADKIINDEKAPEALKKGMKILKIISEGIIEGWAVLWGARTGAKFAKNGAIKTVNSKFAKNVGKGLKSAGEFITKGFEKLSESKLAKKAGELVEKLDKTKFGKYIVSAGRAVVKGIKTVVEFVRTKLGKATKADIESTYDKVANGTATTLGVGSGIAGTYSAAKKASPKHFEDIEEIGDYEDFEDIKDEVEGLGD